MLTLFPKFKKRLILFEVLYIALMVVLYILKPGANSIAMLLMLLVGALLIAAAQYINAVNAHNRRLPQGVRAAPEAESEQSEPVHDDSHAHLQCVCRAGTL